MAGPGMKKYMDQINDKPPKRPNDPGLEKVLAGPCSSGIDAAKRGQPEFDNPYPAGSWGHRSWHVGWEEGGGDLGSRRLRSSVGGGQPQGEGT